MRGVYAQQKEMHTRLSGSSPHARGLPRRGAARRGHHGIIPACAGFTISPTAAPTRTPDHPRMRGVYSVCQKALMFRHGSSPHARGLHTEKRHRLIPHRIIPACAGFTSRGVNESENRADHPRTRGVYVVPPRLGRGWRGSSPHTRGLQGRVGRADELRGIIPAHAGFTRRARGGR